MQTSIFIARLLGPVLLVAGIAMRWSTASNSTAIVQELFLQPAVLLLLLGIIDLLSGLRSC